MMETNLKATAGRSDVYHRVRIVGDGELNRFLDQTGEVCLEMAGIVPVERFHAVTLLLPPAGLFCALLTENG